MTDWLTDWLTDCPTISFSDIYDSMFLHAWRSHAVLHDSSPSQGKDRVFDARSHRQHANTDPPSFHSGADSLGTS